MNYPAIVIRHFEQPQNAGEFSEQSNVITAKCGTVSAGDLGQLQLKLKDRQIVEARFKAYGNPYFIASLSLLTEMLVDKTLDEAGLLSHEDLIKTLEMPNTKIHSALLAEDLLQAALKAATE